MTQNKEQILNSTEKIQENNDLELDVSYSRLKKIGKDKFLVDFNQNENILVKVKSSSQYFNISIPHELQEYFIDIEDASLFWILDSPIMPFIDEGVKQSEKDAIKGESDPYKLIKEYYSKWVTTTRKSEKKYFAQSLIKSISKEKYKTILSSIYGGVLFTFDETHRNSDSAQQYYEQAEMLIGQAQWEENIKIELQYLIKVYCGFDYFQLGRIFEASQKFKDAIIIKNNGVTAKFYLALTEILLNNLSAGFDAVCDIYEYDMNRISYTISNNNFILYQYFIKNSIFKNIFQYREFGSICSLLEDYLEGKELDCYENLARIRKKFEIFKELHLSEYQEIEVKNSIGFIEKMLKTYFTSSLNLFLASVSILWAKFYDTLQLVLATIRQRYVAETQNQLRVYDNNIMDLNGLIDHLTKEIADFKIRYKEKVKISIAHYELHFQEQMNYLERKLVHFSGDSESNPASAFKSSISYTLILSALVVLVAGFASYSTNYAEELNGFGQIVKAILLTGGKWGIITFIIGFFISTVSTVYAVYERSMEKQKVIKEIANLKYVKEKNIEHIRAEAERNEKITIKNLNERIEQHKKRIKEITEERIRQEEKLYREIEEKIKVEANKLIELIEKA